MRAQALKDKNDWVRMQVAQTLGWIGDARAVEPLIQALKDDASARAILKYYIGTHCYC